MDSLNTDGVPSRRGPRRAETLPVRFVVPGQDEINVRDRSDLEYRRRERREAEPVPGLPRRQSTLESFESSSRRHERGRYGRPERRESRDYPSEARLGHGGRHRRRKGRNFDQSSLDSEDRVPEAIHESAPEGSETESDTSGSDTTSSSDRYYRRRSRRRAYGGEDESDYESDAERDVYNFSLPRHHKSSLSPDGSLDGSDPSIKTEVNFESQSALSGTKPSTPLHVYRSQYTGEGSVGGLQSARLSAIHDPKKSRSSLFRWIHFEDPAMHFEDFQAGVAQIPALTDSERTGVTKLLGRVRQRFDKPLQTSKGTKVRFMEPSLLQDTLSRGERSKDKSSRPRTVTWLCLPYFCLEEYSGVLAASRSGAHPMRTLLQTRFSLARKERDLQQAVHNLPDTPAGFCFQIAQVWCIVLDDCLLVTCARIPMSALHGNSISVVSGPMPEQSKGRSPRILVSYGESVLWSFKVDDCQTWFAFLSHFWEFWPRRFRILYQGRVLSADLWGRILNLAKHASPDVRLTFELGATHRSITRGILRVSERPPVPDNASIASHGDALNESRAPQTDSDARQGQGSNDVGSLLRADFCVLTWLNAGKTDHGSRPFNVNKVQLNDDLERMDHYLSARISLTERVAYRECPEVSHDAVYQSLEQEMRSLADSAGKNKKKDERRQRILERRIDVFNAAESIIQFYLPLKFEGPTVLKFWGAIHQLLEASSPDKPRDHAKHSKKGRRRDNNIPLSESDLSDFLEGLEMIVRHVQPFKDFLSQATPDDRSRIDIPEELLKAWLHLLMSLVFSTRDSGLCEEQLGKSVSLMVEGMKQIVRNLNRKSLLDKSVFMPFEVSSMVNFQLLQDMTGVHPDITETYGEYLKALEANIEANPLDRTHQDKLTLVKQEITVVRKTLGQQSKVLNALLYSTRVSRGGGRRRDLKSSKSLGCRRWSGGGCDSEMDSWGEVGR